MLVEFAQMVVALILDLIFYYFRPGYNITTTVCGAGISVGARLLNCDFIHRKMGARPGSVDRGVLARVIFSRNTAQSVTNK